MSINNSLAEKYPEIAKEWHPTKNGDLKPDQVAASSNKKAWWLFTYDDPNTGKHFDFEWEAKISNRTVRKSKCPFLTGNAVWPGFNDLAGVYPEVAKEWHPTKNGDVTPDQVVYGSNQSYWWLKSYDDPETRKHFDFEWKAPVVNRTVRQNGCPYLAGVLIWPGYNDLATKYPELAAEWHPTKNGDRTPDQVAPTDKKTAWWIRSYDDPKTGKHFDFEWETRVINRTERGTGCPYLTNRKTWPGFNDLATTHPHLAAEWHPTKNGDLTPQDVTGNMAVKVWWQKEYDDPDTGKHYIFEWESTIANRAMKGAGCPYLAGKVVEADYNSLAAKYPEVAKEWNSEKNGSLTPDKVSYGSNQRVWWKQSYDDPETGEHFEFEWEDSIKNRTTGGYGCPYIAGKKVLPGFNDLESRFPELAAQWHPTKNGTLKPSEVSCGSEQSVWWQILYSDPDTGKHYSLEWDDSVHHRALNKYGCPYLAGTRVLPGFNDLASRYPDLAAQWHPVKNGELTPQDVTCGSSQIVWWYLPYDDPETGNHFDFEWPATISSRVFGNGCPYLSNLAVWKGFNDLATTHPEIAAQWHPIKNGELTPSDVTYGSKRIVWWYLPYDDPKTGKHFDFEWYAPVNALTSGHRCPYLLNRKVWPGYNDLQSRFPEFSKDWHPTRNRRRTPDKTMVYTNQKVWWKCSVCGFEWRTSVLSRTKKGSECPNCRELNRGIFTT